MRVRARIGVRVRVKVEVGVRVRPGGHLGEEKGEGGATPLVLQHYALRVEDRHLKWWWGCRLQAGRMGLQARCVGSQARCVGSQAGCVGLPWGCRLGA